MFALRGHHTSSTMGTTGCYTFFKMLLWQLGCFFFVRIFVPSSAWFQTVWRLKNKSKNKKENKERYACKNWTWYPKPRQKSSVFPTRPLEFIPRVRREWEHKHFRLVRAAPSELQASKLFFEAPSLSWSSVRLLMALSVSADDVSFTLEPGFWSHIIGFPRK